MNTHYPMITKTVQTEEVAFIQFTEEEMTQLGLKPHDKFEVKLGEDNSIILKKFSSIDIDLAELPREALESLIAESVKKQVPVDEIIRDLLRKMVDSFEKKEPSKKKSKKRR